MGYSGPGPGFLRRLRVASIRLGYPSAAARRSAVPCANLCKGKSAVSTWRYLDRRARCQAAILWGRPKRLYALGVPRNNPGHTEWSIYCHAMADSRGVFLGDVDRVSAALGVVSILMIVVFGVAVGEPGVNGSKLFWGYYRRCRASNLGRRRVVSGRQPCPSTQVLFCVVLGQATEAMTASAPQRRWRSAAMADTAVDVDRRHTSILIAATGAGVARRGDVDGAAMEARHWSEALSAGRRESRGLRFWFRVVRGGLLVDADGGPGRGLMFGQLIK